ncbi:MAG: type II toxin-antitoxin system PemK/MazF family toxin [Minisyncoccia bacterium]
MQKNFDKWNNKKKEINNQDSFDLFFHEREIWWCSLGLNIGYEQDGSEDNYRRPVLILKGLSLQICLVIPLTSSIHIHSLRPSIGIVDGKNAKALISQIRVIDKKRLVSKIGYLDQETFDKIRKIVKDLI